MKREVVSSHGRVVTVVEFVSKSLQCGLSTFLYKYKLWFNCKTPSAILIPSPYGGIYNNSAKSKFTGGNKRAAKQLGSWNGSSTKPNFFVYFKRHLAGCCSTQCRAWKKFAAGSSQSKLREKNSWLIFLSENFSHKVLLELAVTNERARWKRKQTERN